MTFDAACDSIGSALPRRPEIVDGILASKASAQPLARLRYFLRSHTFEAGPDKLLLQRVVKPLDNRGRADGFNVLHDWDGPASKFNKEMIPVDVLNYLMRARDPGDPERTALAILLDYYFFYVLGLLSLRVWDEDDADGNVDRVNRLLDDLQGPAGSGQRFVANHATLVLLATSHFEGEDDAYSRLVERLKSLGASHRTDAALIYAGVLASHLRFGLQAAYGRDVGKLRDDNVADYPLLCFALATLMDSYGRLIEAGIDGPDRDVIAEAIVNGLSPDAAAYLGDPTPALAECEAERRRFADGFHEHREELLADFHRLRPTLRSYSPVSLFFNFPHNLVKGTVVDALLRDKPWSVTLNDLLTGVAIEPANETQQTLAETLMGYARSNPDPYRGRLVPSIVYDPRAGRRDYERALEAIESAK